MNLEGGCYCGSLRFKVEGEPVFRGQCHCRECQYISGGGANYVLAMPDAGFAYTEGGPKGFARTDLDTPVTREFCENCGTHILAKSPGMPGFVMLKAGVLDDPSAFGQAQAAIFLCDKQEFQQVPDGVPGFSKGPGSAPA